LSEVDVAAHDSVESVADHLFSEFAHAGQVDIRLHARVAEDAQGALGDIDGLISDALQINVDARDGQGKTEIDGHELVQGKKLNDAVIDFQLELVDGVFFLEDALGEHFVGFEHRVDGLVNGTLGEAAHPEEPLFQLVYVFFEMAFHNVSALLRKILTSTLRILPAPALRSFRFSSPDGFRMTTSRNDSCQQATLELIQSAR
jgi:hypothetical protein